MRVLAFLLLFGFLVWMNFLIGFPVLKQMRLMSIVESIPAREDGKYAIGEHGVYAVFCTPELSIAAPKLSMLPMASGFQTEMVETDKRGQDRATGDFVKAMTLVTVSQGTDRKEDLLLDLGNSPSFKAGRFLGMKKSGCVFFGVIGLAAIESLFIFFLLRRKMRSQPGAA